MPDASLDRRMNSLLENEFLQRSTAWEKPDPTLRLSALEWRLLTAVDGLTSLAEFARGWEVAPEAMEKVAEKLKSAGHLVRAEFTLAEYQAAVQAVEAASPAPEPVARKYSASLKRRATTAGIPTASGGGSGAASAASGAGSTAAPLPSANRPLSSIGTTPAAASPGAPLASVAPEERGPGFPLRPLINFIIQQAGGGTMGQLAVYRVFCQVPNELLLKSRITSLNLVGDNFVIQDTTLKNRLLEATRAVLGVDYR